ncbi:uncharacterized protein HKW66_Vig0128870 [Vigna angularis]|uniref:Uncharacterized protein n=1 Tax=Phaseolus angularis TaxID=3914 RepID=A0A8T0K553_PHAAN|nr:uncharacterized protein HKW66_Vig0128870 [Vigna angularis]
MVAEETMGDQLGFSDLGFHGTMGDGWPRRRWAMVAEETMSDPLVRAAATKDEANDTDEGLATATLVEAALGENNGGGGKAKEQLEEEEPKKQGRNEQWQHEEKQEEAEPEREKK